MRKRNTDKKKSTLPVTQSDFVSKRTRPFQVPNPSVEKTEKSSQEATTADIQARLDHADRFGHDLTQSTVQRQIEPEKKEEKEAPIQAKPTVSGPEDKEEDEEVSIQAKAELDQPEDKEEEEETPIQAKLTMGQPEDKEEEEADDMAQRVMAMPEGEVKEEDEEAKGEQIAPKLQKKKERPGIPTGFEQTLASKRGGGNPLDEETRGFMESRFGADFSGVKVHQEPELTSAIQAQAFTHGKDIYFNSGKYAPGTDGGKELLAHELTHVVQQAHGRIQRQGENAVQSVDESREELANSILSQLNQGGINVSIYVEQIDKVKQHREFKRQAEQYALDHLSIGLSEDGELKQGSAIELKESLPNIFQNLSQKIEKLLTSSLETEINHSLPISINSLSIFTHGFSRRLQAGRHGQMVSTEGRIAEQPGRAHREKWTKLADWVSGISPYLSSSPLVNLYACSVSGEPPTGLSFSEALQHALQTELEQRDGKQEGVAPQVWGHSTSGHTTANRYLVGFGGDSFSERQDLLTELGNRLAELAIEKSGKKARLTDRQYQKIRTKGRKLVQRKLRAGRSRLDATNAYMKEIPQMGIERVWQNLSMPSTPNFSDLGLSQEAVRRVAEGHKIFNQRFSEALLDMLSTIQHLS